MPENVRSIPYPAFALVVAPFISKLAAHRGLGTGSRALVAGLGVLLLASVLSLISGPRTRRSWIFVVAAGVAAVVGSLLADVLG